METDFRTQKKDTAEAVWIFMEDIHLPNHFGFIERKYTDQASRNIFCNMLLTEVDTTNAYVTCHFLPLRLHIQDADSEYSEYIMASSRCSAVTQTRPVIPNVANGLGWLATRKARLF